MKRTLVSITALLALAACHRPADSAFYNRGGPEALLDASSEVVNLSVAGPAELSQLSSWVAKDKPTRAELYCTAGNPACNQARQTLDQHGIPTMMVASGDNMVALVYERVLARDCNQRFVDNAHNNYNESPRSFGCSISANIVQEVADKQQFVNPNIGDPTPATGPVAAYGRAYAPKATKTDSYNVQQSTINSAKTE